MSRDKRDKYTNLKYTVAYSDFIEARLTLLKVVMQKLGYGTFY